jgi:O-antigen biosynthesis protein
MESPLAANGGGVSALAALTDSHLDPLFRDAARIDRDSAWFGHLPFAFWLMQVVRPTLLVELGTHNGISYAAFCQSVLREGMNTQCFLRIS